LLCEQQRGTCTQHNQTKTKLYTPWYVLTPSMIDTCSLGQTWLSVG
jgi:hypothetical protein